MGNKCYKCPDCSCGLKETSKGYYCKNCDEYFEKRYIEKRRKDDYN